MKWASAIATPARLEDAIDEAGSAIRGELGGSEPDLVVAFPSQDHADYFELMPELIAAMFPEATLIGCSAGGVIGGGREIEFEPSLSLTAANLPGVNVQPFHLSAEGGWDDNVPVPPSEEPDLIVLPDPHTCDAQALVRWLDGTYPHSTKVGGLASGGGQPGSNVLFAGKNTHRSGAVGIALTGNVEVDTIVAQGCRPIGSPMFITRCNDNVILELDGRPAVKALESLYAGLPRGDQDLFRHSLFLGVVMREDLEVYEHGDFLVRNLMGIDAKQSAIAVAAQVQDNQVVQFHLRDAEASADDLAQILSKHTQSSPKGALLFSCMGRGKGLYGVADHDTEAFHEHLGPVPLGGFFCNGEIGPVHGQTFLHGYTSSFGLFRPKHPQQN